MANTSRQAGPVRRPGGRRRKKRRSPFLYILIFAVLLGAGAAACVMLYFKVGTIEVKGSTPYSTQQIQQASGVRAGQNLLQINTGQAEKKLCAALPYVKTASVKRKLLSTVVITVSPDQAAGVVQNAGKSAVVDSEMKVLEAAAGNVTKKNAPVITGLKFSGAEPGKVLSSESPVLLETLRELYRSMEANGIAAGKITAIDLTSTYNLSMSYEGKISILLGTASNAEYKLKTAKAIITKQLPNEKGTLDVSNASPDSSDVNKIYFDPA